MEDAGRLACAAVRAFDTPDFDAAMARLRDARIGPTATLEQWRRLQAADRARYLYRSAPFEREQMLWRRIDELLGTCNHRLEQRPARAEWVRAQLDQAAAAHVFDGGLFHNLRHMDAADAAQLAAPYDAVINECLPPERQLPRATPLQRLRAVRTPAWARELDDTRFAQLLGFIDAPRAAQVVLARDGALGALPRDALALIAREAMGLNDPPP